MTMFDRLTGLAQRALNKTPAPAKTTGSAPRDWKSTLRGAVGPITGAAPPRLPRSADRRHPSRHRDPSIRSPHLPAHPPVLHPRTPSG